MDVLTTFSANGFFCKTDIITKGSPNFSESTMVEEKEGCCLSKDPSRFHTNSVSPGLPVCEKP